MALTVASWNMSLGFGNSSEERISATWSFLNTLMDRHDIDVALLQEAKAPPGQSPLDTEPRADELVWETPIPKYGRQFCASVAWRRSGFAVAPRRPVPLANANFGDFAISHPGQFAVVDVRLEDGTAATLVSLYGLFDPITDSKHRYPDGTLHRAISDLLFLLQERKTEIVIAGDLNVWHQYFDGHWSTHHEEVFDRLAAYDAELIGPFRGDDVEALENCPCRAAKGDSVCRHVVTFRANKKPTNRPYQNDYIFATSGLRARLTKSYAIDDDDVWEHSDHLPVVAVFNA